MSLRRLWQGEVPNEACPPSGCPRSPDILSVPPRARDARTTIAPRSAFTIVVQSPLWCGRPARRVHYRSSDRTQQGDLVIWHTDWRLSA